MPRSGRGVISSPLGELPRSGEGAAVENSVQKKPIHFYLILNEILKFDRDVD
jgi:hypothetical protein